MGVGSKTLIMIRSKVAVVFFFFLSVVIAASVFLLGSKREIPVDHVQSSKYESSKKEGFRTIPSCDLFSGRWVLANKSASLYNGTRCSFMTSEFACEKYGRKDLKYQDWQWQPHGGGCDLPRFNGAALLEKLRGKKLIFVGDSLGRNQYISLLCMIESSVSASSSKSVTRNGSMFMFHDVGYDARIGFYWSPFLVESNNDDPAHHWTKNVTVRIESIENHARHWSDADILVFDSFVWWYRPSITILWDGSFESSDAKRTTVEEGRYRVYEMGLSTWSDWLEFNINTSKTNLFFTGLSPTHIAGETWNEKRSCYNVSEPIFKDAYWGASTDREMMRVVESAILKLGTRGVKVEYMNITHMSDYRIDAHPSIYREFFSPLTRVQLEEPASYSDCGHWCLPGLPDVWNVIFYGYIIKI